MPSPTMLRASETEVSECAGAYSTRGVSPCLRRAFASSGPSCRVDGGGVLLLSGESGIGKSALCGYAIERAAGMTVLSAQGMESEAYAAGMPRV